MPLPRRSAPSRRTRRPARCWRGCWAWTTRSDGARLTMDLGGLRGGHTGDGSHVVRLTGHRSRPGPGPSTTGTRRRDAASLGIPARGGAHGGGVWRRSHRDAPTLTVGGTEPDRHLYADAGPEPGGEPRAGGVGGADRAGWWDDLHGQGQGHDVGDLAE